MASFQKNQRVGVFLDVQNMYYSALQLYDSKVDFRRMLTECVGDRRLVRAFAYVIKADLAEEKGFFEALEDIGFEVRIKDLQVFIDGSKKGDWDVGMAMDAVRMAQKLDAVVIISGDGDFIDLLQYLRSQGCRVEVMSFKKTASAKLIETADHFHDLDGNKKYLRAKKKPQSKPSSKGAQKPAAARRPQTRKPGSRPAQKTGRKKKAKRRARNPRRPQRTGKKTLSNTRS
ncbi:MAG: NYN domain-containing protein [Candidatus Altiarchaeales archaeon]|nr:NYN domain-containing protein [Candidatus Altiarchaeales archaeon]MBD3416995.1 NYN domain-containing protein [Candidatus Altiarchaeales archaeon]